MKDLFNIIYRYFIPSEYTKDSLVHRKAKILINVLVITILFALFYIIFELHFRLGHIGSSLWIVFIILTITLWLFKWSVPFFFCSNLYVAVAFLSCFIEVFYNGGLSSPILPWMAIVPVTAVLLNNNRNGWLWVIISLLGILIIGLMQISGFNFPNELPENKNLNIINDYAGLMIIIFIIVNTMEKAYISTLKKLKDKNKIILDEKQKSENLLLNILPEEISNELKQTGKTKAHSYDMATVMFSDFVNFTRIGERLTPEELVSAIAEYFETFDHIIERYGIEKIKTVGDAYICAAGLPIPTTDNALIMIQVAFDFLKALDDLNEKRHIKGQVIFNIRVGINTGPLVAGVVGIKKFAYDIWGDTVNTAARLQEKGEAGRINISGSTYDLIKQAYPCTYRGKIEAKNKGQIDMYFVENTYQNILDTQG